jgi:hypothetical protein
MALSVSILSQLKYKMYSSAHHGDAKDPEGMAKITRPLSPLGLCGESSPSQGRGHSCGQVDSSSHKRWPETSGSSLTHQPPHPLANGRIGILDHRIPWVLAILYSISRYVRSSGTGKALKDSFIDVYLMHFLLAINRNQDFCCVPEVFALESYPNAW